MKFFYYNIKVPFKEQTTLSQTPHANKNNNAIYHAEGRTEQGTEQGTAQGTEQGTAQGVQGNPRRYPQVFFA